MFDVLHFEGALAHYTLRRWGAHVGPANSRAERIRPADEHDALTLLRSAVDSETLRRLGPFVHGSEASSVSLTSDPLELLWLVARRIISGELVLERERIVPMASDIVERFEFVLPPPLVNDIIEGVGLHAKSLAEAEQVALVGQAKQAMVLREAASTGKAFCEACAGASERRVPASERSDHLATQAKQAEALKAASITGVAFCEACANCKTPKLLGTPPPEPPRNELNRQSKQAESLVSAAESGKAFCEQCRC
jgi:hypothetical protein